MKGFLGVTRNEYGFVTAVTQHRNKGALRLVTVMKLGVSYICNPLCFRHIGRNKVPCYVLLRFARFL